MSEEEYATLSAIAPTIPPSIDDLAGDLFYTSFGDPATPIPAIRVPAGLWGS